MENSVANDLSEAGKDLYEKMYKEAADFRNRNSSQGI
jgi:hypothetical protein